MHLSSGTFDDDGGALQEHAQELYEFLAAWTTRQEQLVQTILTSGSKVEERQQPSDNSEDPLCQNPQAVVDVSYANSFEEVKQHVEGEKPDIHPVLRHSSTGISVISDAMGQTSARKSTLIHLSETKPERFLNWVVESVAYKLLAYSSMAVVIFNSGIIAASADYAMANPLAPDSSSFLSACELSCAIYYIIEVSVNVYIHRCEFCKGPEWKWNVFDVLLAIQAVYEQVSRYLVQASGGSNLSFVRMLRLVKNLKLLRIVRLVRVFRELRLLLVSLFGSFKAFLWACALMTTISFMFSVCIMQLCTKYVSESYTDENASEALQGIERYWSSVSLSMLSLAMSATGGQDWATLAAPLQKVGPSAHAMLVIFVALYHVVIMNIVNSMFIEALMNDAQKDHQMMIDGLLEKKGALIAKLQGVFAVFDKDGDGEIEFDEFCGESDNVELVAFMESLEIEYNAAKHFFRVLSGGGKNPVDLETFVDGCIKMKGHARSSDLMDLLYQHKAFCAEHRKRFNVIEDMVDKLSKVMISLSATVSTMEATMTTASLRVEPSGVDSWNLPPSVDSWSLPPLRAFHDECPWLCER